MIIVDKALEERQRSGDPIRVGMVGAGFMGRAIALQIIQATKGMELVAIANRTLEKAGRAYQEAGIEAEVVEDASGLHREIERGKPAITEDPSLLCRAEGIDAIIEVTGTVEFAARVAVEAIDHRKHVVLMNAELDGTLGSTLKERADESGVVITNADGDQPGVIMNLYRFVRGIGVRPVLCGNIKGLHDPHRTPSTQEGFARKWGQNPSMVTSFADGTKISFEQAIVANATGMRVARRGMLGPERRTGDADPGGRSVVPSRGAPRRSRNRRLRRRCRAEPRRVRARHDRPSHAASLPESVQARRGTPLLLLYAVSPLPFRGTEHRRPSRALR